MGEFFCLGVQYLGQYMCIVCVDLLGCKGTDMDVGLVIQSAKGGKSNYPEQLKDASLYRQRAVIT